MRRKNLRRWVHLAVTYDRATSRVTFYLDGQQVGEEKIEKSVPLHVGSAWIGQWNTADSGFKGTRNFHGRIEELTIWKCALRDDQIRQLCEGKLRQ